MRTSQARRPAQVGRPSRPSRPSRASRRGPASREADAFLNDPTDPPSRQAILRAALKLFVARGYEETTIRAIADEAGYTNPALFKFFPNKEALGAHVFERCYRELMRVLEVLLTDTGASTVPLEETMGRWASALIELLSERPHAMLFVHDHLALFWPKVGRRLGGRSLFTLMSGWLEHNRKSGRVSAVMPVAMQLAASSGLFHQLAVMVHLGEIDRASLGDLQAHLTTMLVDILRAGAKQPGSTS